MKKFGLQFYLTDIHIDSHLLYLSFLVLILRRKVFKVNDKSLRDGLFARRVAAFYIIRRIFLRCALVRTLACLFLTIAFCLLPTLFFSVFRKNIWWNKILIVSLQNAIGSKI